MSFQAKNIKDYYKAAEILYAFHSVNVYYDAPVSRIAIQKIIYLAQVVSPVLKVILNYLENFRNYYRGPYDSKIQNLTDHLALMGYLELVDYQYKGDTQLTTYKITDIGINVVENMTQLKSEEYKLWVYHLIVRQVTMFIDRVEKSKWSGFDRIVDLVYKDLTFVESKANNNLMVNLSLNNPSLNTLDELYDFVVFKNNSRGYNSNLSNRQIAEQAVYNYFEGIFSNHITIG